MTMTNGIGGNGKRREIPVHRAEERGREKRADERESTSAQESAAETSAEEVSTSVEPAPSPKPVGESADAGARTEQTTPVESGQDAAAQAPANDREGELMAEIERLQAERDEHYENWLRARAELDNYRKRIQRELDENARYAAVPVVQDMLPVLDNIRRAVEAARQSKRVDELLQGIEMIVQQFEEVLIKHNAVPIESVGQPFNPELHEAVQKVETEEHPPMTVIHEVQRGYKLHDRLIRPSKVVVATRPEGTDTDKQGGGATPEESK
ncbi:MAG: nucleotide exchange factor GrpE [Planctomycetota bacterium]|nr:MAG: nucleotide exchange factor GrpE [Planctomycetota bacterium]